MDGGSNGLNDSDPIVDYEETDMYKHLMACEQGDCKRFGVVVLTKIFLSENDIPMYVTKWSRGIKFNHELIKYWHLIRNYRYKNTAKSAPGAIFIYYEGESWKKI